MQQMLKVKDIAKRFFGSSNKQVSVPLSDEEQKGTENEKRAFALIDTLLKEESLIPLNSRPYIAERYSEDDLDGFDIVIPSDKGKLGIQVKSSYGHLVNFQKKNHNIPVVVVNQFKTDERLKIELRSALMYAYDQLNKGRVWIT